MAVRRLADAGVDVGVAVAPILPVLSDRPALLEQVVREARASGARSIWSSVVNLRPGVKEHFLAALARDWPDQVSRYEELFSDRAYLPSAIARAAKEPVSRAAAATRARPRRGSDLYEPPQLALSI